ncbi:hypothetical protein LQV05_006478 [Cryptococcus neoformans]|nr:hypothetical protein LQV05_006478 [Cryptococcus neoformans]
MPISHDQIVQDEELDQRVDLTANFGQRVCVKQAELHLRLYAEYIELYQKDFGENAVFDWDRCIKTCNQVLGNRMKASKGGVTHQNGDYQSKMKFQTLRVLRNAMVIVLKMEASDATAHAKRRFWDEIDNFLGALRLEFNMSFSPAAKIAIYSEEIAVLIGHILKKAVAGDVDPGVAVQQALFLNTLMHTAGRPSVLIPGKSTTFFMRWEDVEIRPRRIQNIHAVGSSTSNMAKTVHMYISTSKREETIVFDLGALLIAHGLRLGVFGSSATVKSLYSSSAVSLPIIPEWRNRPVFYRTASRGHGLDLSGPLRYDSARERFTSLLLEADMPCSTDTCIVGLSSIRRGSATKLEKAFGSDDARLLLGHIPDSTVLEGNYTERREGLDVAAAVTGDERLDEAVPRLQLHILSMQRPGDSVPFETLLAYDPPLRTYQSALQAVQASYVAGDDDWLEHPLWMMCKEQEYLSHPSKAVTKVRAAIRNRVKALRTLYQQRRSNAIWETSANLTYAQALDAAKSVMDLQKSLPMTILEAVHRECAGALASVEDTDLLGDTELFLDDEDLDIDCSFDFFSDLEPLGGDDGKSGFRRKVLPQSSDGLGSILEIRHLKAKWTGALTLLHSSQSNGANRVPLPCPECKADEALEPEAREKLYLPAGMLKHRLQNHLLEHRMRDHFGKNDQGKVECPCCTKEYHSLAALCGHIVRQHPNSGGKEIPKAAVNVPFHQLTFRHWLDCHQLLADRQRYGDDQDDRLPSLKGRLRQRELLGYLTVEGANELQEVADECRWALH